MRIEICGGIGAGKTTLAKLLSYNGFEAVLENFEINPFWVAFYAYPGKYIFETEMTFLLQHYHEIKRSAEISSRVAVDFSFTQDLAYAEMGMTGKRLQIFKDTCMELIYEVGNPDLLIYVKCPEEILLERIKKRNRAQENLIDSSFLANLDRHIYSEVGKNFSNQKIMVIDSSVENYINDEETKTRILKEVNALIA